MDIDVKHVAELAHLSLLPAETPAIEAELKSILLRFERLKAVDVTGVPPTFVAGDIVRLEPEQDVPRPSLARGEVLEMAPAKQGPYVSVPREGSPGAGEMV